MADMLTSIKILPTNVDVNLEDLKNRIKEALPPEVRLYKTSEEPIAFGLTALITHFIMPESESGIMTKLENLLKSMEDVGEIQVINMTRL